MNYDTLAGLLGEFSRARVVVLGDVMLDRFVYGGIERISPEAPIPVLSVERATDMPGGAANVARNCASLGARTILLGVVGDDVWAGRLRSQLDAEPGIDARLVCDTQRPTTVKTRYVADRQQILRADSESRAALPDDIAALVLRHFEEAIAEADIVILSDYAKGVLSGSVVAQAIVSSRALGKIVVVDPKSRDFSKYAGASVLTPNRPELQLASGEECLTDEQVARAAGSILADKTCEAMVVTRGRDGMSVITAPGAAIHIRTVAREVFDVSGAGDTALATLALALAVGGTLADAASLANICAGIVVGKHGTAVATIEEAIASLDVLNKTAPSTKVFGLSRVLQQVRHWRAQSQRIAFTNGCFDLLHPGHVSLLEQAKRTADKLVVGLNSDSSVHRLKGPGRPIQNETARAMVLSSLKAVDAVVIFSEDTPLSLIQSLEPDVLVKGADYTLETVVGADVVTARGGKVVLADLVNGHSTTSMIKRSNAP